MCKHCVDSGHAARRGVKQDLDGSHGRVALGIASAMSYGCDDYHKAHADVVGERR